MTTIYLPVPSENSELCHPVRNDDFEIFRTTLNGTSRRSTWLSPEMYLVRKDEGKELSMSDSPWLGQHALVLRRRAAAALEPLLSQYGELLPIACTEADLLVLNVTCVVDALNERESEIQRFSSSDRIMAIWRHVFRPELVADIDIFKIPVLRVSPIFVGERFVQAWISAGLSGLVFSEVWSG
jgi:hypothetical protein